MGVGTNIMCLIINHFVINTQLNVNSCKSFAAFLIPCQINTLNTKYLFVHFFYFLEEFNEAIRLSKKTAKLLYLHLNSPLLGQGNDSTLLHLEKANIPLKM